MDKSEGGFYENGGGASRCSFTGCLRAVWILSLHDVRTAVLAGSLRVVAPSGGFWRAASPIQGYRPAPGRFVAGRRHSVAVAGCFWPRRKIF